MSLRLLLLRSNKSAEEEEVVKTMLDSYSSYSNGGRAKADIATMLARDFMFLRQQHPSATTQAPLNLGRGAIAASTAAAAAAPSSTGLSLFGLPSANSSIQNSPALTPIPGPDLLTAPEPVSVEETLSIVSN